ncbi:uncharacterized protein LOC111299047 isoform X2 [Durio zibethinus]|uniref:Uncharacterized protein LOC111299047 isoform X2 n=1 Tax=Durio zibethinus TaxID=66656 RepID=A0A6P5ZA91_DURZI|nr:uncharacterized protein LOC111299047 isoform X2 [Durio zibethinus]
MQNFLFSFLANMKKAFVFAMAIPTTVAVNGGLKMGSVSQAYLESKIVKETRSLVSELFRQFYNLGWVSKIGGSIAMKVHDSCIPKPQELNLMSPSADKLKEEVRLMTTLEEEMEHKDKVRMVKLRALGNIPLIVLRPRLSRLIIGCLLISPTEIRGALGSINQLFICIGILAALMAGLPLAGNWLWWRTMFGIAVVPSILLALGMALSPESPWWLFQGKFLKLKNL